MDDYKILRNVQTDYKAVGDGIADDTDAINNAIKDGGRCGSGCKATSTKGAIVYFPRGKYRITKPIVQYYFTQFIGDPHNPPTIIGDKSFEGIALIDTNVYTGGNEGKEQW